MSRLTNDMVRAALDAGLSVPASPGPSPCIPVAVFSPRWQPFRRVDCPRSGVEAGGKVTAHATARSPFLVAVGPKILYKDRFFFP